MAKRFSKKDPKVGDKVNVFLFQGEENKDINFPAVIVGRLLVDEKKLFVVKANDLYDVYDATCFKVVND